MNKNVFILLLSTLAVCLAGCKKECEPEKEIAVEESEIIWSLDLKERFGYTGNVYLKDSLVIFGINAHPFICYGIHKKTGEIIWEFEDFHPSFDATSFEHTTVSGDYIALTSGRRTYVLNMNSGEKMWEHYLPQGANGISIINNYVYKSTNENPATHANIYRYELVTGKLEKVFNLKKSEFGGSSPDLMPPTGWIHPSGDQVIVLQNRTHVPRMDVFAYNVTADSMLWYRKGLDSRSSMSPPAISGNLAYFFGYHTVHCIDINDGATHWQYNAAKDNSSVFALSNILLKDDLLFVKPENSWLIALDKETGSVIWENDNTESLARYMTIETDTLYFGSVNIFGIDVEYGDVVIDYQSPNNGSFISPVGIDPENGNIYSCDNQFIYCLDPKKL